MWILLGSALGLHHLMKRPNQTVQAALFGYQIMRTVPVPA
jgi:hypothetical protein